MTRIHSLFVVGLAGALAFSCMPKTPTPDTAPAKAANASADLANLADAYWAELMRVSPTWATRLGDRSRDAELPDVSWAARQAHLGKLRDMQTTLKGIDRIALSASERITADVLAHELDSKLGTAMCNDALWEVDQLSGPQVWLGELPGYHTIQTKKNADDLSARYLAAKGLFEAHVANLRMGLAAGYVAPHINVERVLRQLDSQLDTRMEDSPYMEAVAHLPANWSDEEKRAVRDELLTSVRDGMYPGLATYRDFLRHDVLPRARKEVGVSANPRGDLCYRAKIASYIGEGYDAEKLHELGLSEVARIQKEMIALIRADGSQDDIPTYFAKLKKQRGQYFDTPEKLLAYNRELVDRANAALPRAFGKLPKTKVELKEIEAFRAADAPAAYYYSAPRDGSRPGYYYVNTYKPEERPLYNMAALAFHESVPGHHLQIALMNENESLPEFQRRVGQTAFVEGWALYAEGLADDLGLYRDTHEKLGRLNYEMWRAVRLVVDTGMHAQGWSREQAIEYLAQHTGNPEEEVVNEIDRYITWPGQALAYKVGQLEFLSLRKKAQARLGDRFDLRAFHDRALENGAVPLPTLRRTMDAWIEDQVASAGASEKPVNP